MLRPAHGAARAATGGGGIPGRGPAGTGRTGPGGTGRPARGQTGGGREGAGDSTGGGGRGRMAVGNRRGERKSMHAIAAGLPPERPPPPHEKRHVGVLEFFPFCIRDADQLLVSRCQVALVVTQPRQRRAKPRLRHHLLSALRRALPPRTSGGDTASPMPGETWAPSPPGRLVHRLPAPGGGYSSAPVATQLRRSRGKPRLRRQCHLFNTRPRPAPNRRAATPKNFLSGPCSFRRQPSHK